jgi:cytoskeletal protein RodZ
VEKGLRELRISAGLEIEDISGRTGINRRYLTAIEKGDFAALPGDIYARGYIREYAKCLGVPFAAALQEYESYLQRKGRETEEAAGQKAGKTGFISKLERFFHLKGGPRASHQEQPCR